MSASIPTTEFQHEPLPNRTWIRLIRIHPDLEYGNLVCTLEHFGPKSRPPYVALSYCWGDPTPRHTVHINGLVRKVHENLWRFLHRAWMNKETDWFWTDSICIDQAHHSELNDQVTRMGNIYSQADHVISWLG
ncbi:HET-domain-containing protein, partial [Cryphonectria parasitica EP155]